MNKELLYTDLFKDGVDRRIIIDKKEDVILSIGKLFAVRNNFLAHGTASLIQMSIPSQIIQDEYQSIPFPE